MEKRKKWIGFIMLLWLLSYFVIFMTPQLDLLRNEFFLIGYTLFCISAAFIVHKLKRGIDGEQGQPLE